MKVKKNWSDYVTKHSIALDLEEGVFTWDNPQRIAKSLKLSAENSLRRKTSPFQSAMSMLNFYINRAGKNLPPERKRILEKAKIELRKAFMNYYVYILQTSSNTLYIGQTNNLEKRIQEHKNKSSKSAKYIRYFPSFKLVYSETYKTRKEAMQREIQLKKLTRAKKEALIASINIDSLKRLMVR